MSQPKFEVGAKVRLTKDLGFKSNQGPLDAIYTAVDPELREDDDYTGFVYGLKLPDGKPLVWLDTKYETEAGVQEDELEVANT